MTNQSITPATNLDDAYRVCDPDEPLSATDPRYVDLSAARGTLNISSAIARKIRRCTGNSFHQQLLTGHRGSGKSTELLRLQAALEKQDFFVIYFDVEELLDLGDLNYLDVLLCIAKEIERNLRENRISLNADLIRDLEDWFKEKIIEKQENHELSGNLKTAGEADVKIPFIARLLASFTAEIKTASSRRSITREVLEREQAVFIEKLNALILDARNKVQQAGRQDLVLIVDGLEKTQYRLMSDGQSTHAHLFVHHAEQLKAPCCHIIYTTPIFLVFSANLGNDFDVLVMPMVKTDKEGVDRLRETIGKRLDIHQVFQSPGLIDELIKLSGGVMRDLMRLIRFATETDQAKITQIEVDYAKQTLIREYDRLVRDNEIEQMRWVSSNQRVQGDDAYTRMLNLRIILEYQNGERWADLHPAVIEIPWVKKALLDDKV